MKILDKYFRISGKTLLIEHEIHELNKQIRVLRKKQQRLYNINAKYETEVRQMFDDGIFNDYGKLTRFWFNKLWQLKHKKPVNT
jgi:hypothetical protein